MGVVYEVSNFGFVFGGWGEELFDPRFECVEKEFS